MSALHAHDDCDLCVLDAEMNLIAETYAAAEALIVHDKSLDAWPQSFMDARRALVALSGEARASTVYAEAWRDWEHEHPEEMERARAHAAWRVQQPPSRIIEALLVAYPEPLTARALAALLDLPVSVVGGHLSAFQRSGEAHREAGGWVSGP